MKAAQLLSYFQRMLDEHWAYRWGSAKTGEVDCAGAFVWAFKQEGTAIYHGSNRMARTETIEMLPVHRAQPGMLAFKRKRPGENGYALPAEYQEGASRYNGDLNDYYHVGLVDEDPDYVLNAQSVKTGFVRSRITENWDFVAYGKRIDYGEDDEDMSEIVDKTGIVTADSGSTVNMRKHPGKDADLVVKVPVGEAVTVLSQDGEWLRVRRGKYEGYMMRDFVQMDEAGAPADMEERLLQIQRLLDETQEAVQEALREIREA